MTEMVDRLEKVLSLERTHGFRDRAVIGGIKRFIARWEQEALHASDDERTRRQIHIISQLLRGYDKKDPENRASTIAEVLSQLRNVTIVNRPTDRTRSANNRNQRTHDDETSNSAQAATAITDDKPGTPTKQSHKSSRQKSQDTSNKNKGKSASSRNPADRNLPLDAPVDALQGISDTYCRRLARLDIITIEDLLYTYPRRYDDFSSLKSIDQLEYGEEVTIVGTVWESKNRRTRSGQNITSTIFSDATGTIEASWFNQAYLTRELKPGRKIVLSGRVEQYLGRLKFQAPEWEELDQKLLHTARLVPVYPLTKGISARWIRRIMNRVIEGWADKAEDFVPEETRERQNLLPLSEALKQIHFPDSTDDLDKARRRLCFDEFLLIQLGVLRQRANWHKETGRALEMDKAVLNALLAAIPFQLTSAQDRALTEILREMSGAQAMSRLLQGDVGSGKTIVAMIGMLMTVANGAQAALMAPTEILAEQHHKNVLQFLDALSSNKDTTVDTGSSFNVSENDTAPPSSDDEQEQDEDSTSHVHLNIPQVRLLTGSQTKSEKSEIYEEIRSGKAGIVIGTHALIQEGVEFNALAFVTIDEQHRFGVSQRSILRQKGYAPHVLVMTATPIPRTLALTVYGDLDLSVIDEMPPGRQTIRTRKVLPRERERAYRFVRTQIEKGRQAFVICPLIEASDKIETKAATEEYDRLRKDVFPDLRLGLMHGKLKNAQKEGIMDQFRLGALDILVSTSVVEVGIDVPNATVMVIEGADRFGLAQLHQFRGRVGRGEHQSYCLLLADSPSLNAQARLDVVEHTHDGFRLAEEDLKLRGPGEFFGTRQSGLPDLKAAKLSDVDVLETARAEAVKLFERDPDFSFPENASLRNHVNRFWHGHGDLS